MGWEEVVGILVTLVGLFLTVGKPIIELNKNITTLNVTVSQNSADIKAQKTSAHEAHQKLWEHNDEQDKQIADHEKRIFVLEQK